MLKAAVKGAALSSVLWWQDSLSSAARVFFWDIAKLELILPALLDMHPNLWPTRIGLQVGHHRLE